MNQDLRRYPRIPTSQPGKVLAGEALVDVTVRCLSCEGAGVSYEGEEELRPATLVTLRFQLPEREVNLSARVVWSAAGRAGLLLRLAETEADSKKAFGAWIVPRTKQALAERG